LRGDSSRLPWPRRTGYPEPVDVRIKIGDQTVEVPEGTRIADVLAGHADSEIVAATIDNHLVGLDAVLHGDGVLVPVRGKDPLGRAVVKRSVAHMLHAVLRERRPDLRLIVGQSLLGGHFYEVDPIPSPEELEQLARDLSAGLASLAAEDRAFERRALSLEASRRELDDPDGSKSRLLGTLSTPRVATAKLGGFLDLQFGPYALSTRCGIGAEVIPYPPGLILRFPYARPLPGPLAGRRLFETYRKTRDWNRRLGVATVGDLNDAIIDGRIEEVIRVAEALQEKELSEISDEISKRRREVRVVCVAGPSSSGKTTFVGRLSTQLRVNGISPLVVGLDDYYRSREHCPRDEDGELDFESLDALDLDLLQEHLSLLVSGQEAHLPSFDFEAGAPAPRKTWRSAVLGPDQVLLLEGIHGLNPRLTGHLPKSVCYRVYANALTQLKIDSHNRIFTSKGRLLRRIVRDRRYRGTPAAETIARWPSVRRGEAAHIFPFEEEADRVFNSTLVYEVAVLRTYAWRYLLEVPRSHPSRTEAYGLLRFLELFVPVLPDAVPANSVLREFIGQR
jgi:uridine kinase